MSHLTHDKRTRSVGKLRRSEKISEFPIPDEYAIRCFLNKRRKLTHQLTKREAENFWYTAKALMDYLNHTYELGRLVDWYA